MLSITRAVFTGEQGGALGVENCTVLDLPDGTRVRVWVVSVARAGAVRLVFDAPRDVLISRGELFPDPAACAPPPPQPKPEGAK